MDFLSTRRPWLSVGEDFVILACVVLTQCQRVTDRQTDEQTTDNSIVANTGSAQQVMLTPCKTNRIGLALPESALGFQVGFSQSSNTIVSQSQTGLRTFQFSVATYGIELLPDVTSALSLSVFSQRLKT